MRHASIRLRSLPGAEHENSYEGEGNLMRGGAVNRSHLLPLPPLTQDIINEIPISIIAYFQSSIASLRTNIRQVVSVSANGREMKTIRIQEIKECWTNEDLSPLWI